MNYYYKIADIRVLIEIPFQISIQISSEEFISEKPLEKWDMRFICRQTEKLPEVPERGHEENNRCYTENEEGRMIFFRPSPSGKPYACVIWKKAHPDRMICEYLEGNEFRLNYSMSICDMLSLETLLLMYGGLLLHTSLIRWNGRGICFSAPSGVGKSTQAELWSKYQKAEILNGDRAGLRRRPEGWYAYGLPYAGSSRIYRNECAPVTAIIVLKQAADNRIERLSPAAAFCRLYPEILVHQWDPEFADKAIALTMDLLAEVPVYSLECRPDEEAVNLVKNIVSGLPEKGEKHD